jgi:hypothetical protein
VGMDARGVRQLDQGLVGSVGVRGADQYSGIRSVGHGVRAPGSVG